MNRKIKKVVKGYNTKDGAGVSLVRVLGHETIDEFDPILMLDSFDSTNPDDYTAGFPMHPHRGIETISYVYKGKMVHRDSIGNEDAISDGEVQWMNSGSGILHEELVPEAKKLLGVQLWLNLPKEKKMSKPTYNSIKNDEIQEILEGSTKLRLLAGNYKEYEGYKGEHHQIDYYDIHLKENSSFTIETKEDEIIILFTLDGEVKIEGELVGGKSAIKLTNGDLVNLEATNNKAQVLFIRTLPLNEPVKWAGPIVMNTDEQLEEAYRDLQTGNFIKEDLNY